ncbi:DUF4062 domain-containing protein [Tunturibacter psychrotolerans]|uniref:DUF4062 domain-containing protein n=1 Tax=Tunturiibacter psychrotolerans TaxID=3069686 RepID=A0AAU7ZPV2_9BACT
MKVYISSTYQDLVEYRAAVDRTLRRMGHDVIGMEQYIAEGSKPVDRCKADVRVADVYVIIVAWRFGYVPDLSVSPPSPRSITEIELAEAKASGKAVLAFLLDPETPWPPNRVDAMGGVTGASADVLRLRSELGTDYLAGIFRTPDDLASQVAAAVSAQGLTRHMVDRVLGETSVASPDMDTFAQGVEIQLSASSSFSIKNMIRNAGMSRALVLQIDSGDRWWSTRLFLLASLLRSLTTVRQVVFCDTDGRFVGMASPAAIMDGLASAFPELDEFARTLRVGVASSDIERETDRQTSAWNQFLNPPPTGPPQVSPISEFQLKVGVRSPLLEEWIGERWVSRCIRMDGYDLSMSQVQQIVDSLLADVPVQRTRKAPDSGVELLVVDRDAFALELAREWVRSGLPRSSMR